MLPADLLEAISRTLQKNKVERLSKLAGEDFRIRDLIDCCFHPRRELAFRAAWILEYAVMRFPERFLPDLEYFISRYHGQENNSCRRHFTKIIMYLTGASAGSAYREAVARLDLELLIEATFGWLIDAQSPVAVQVNCMDVLFNLKERYSWIGEELALQAAFLMTNGSAAMQSRGRKIRAKLK